MKRKILWVLIIIVILILAAVFFLDPKFVGSRELASLNNNPEINEMDKMVSIGEEFRIDLEDNPTTGYHWLAKYDPNHFELLDGRFIPPENGNMLGEGGMKVYFFKALKQGDSRIDISYVRDWEDEAIEKVVYNISVK